MKTTSAQWFGVAVGTLVIALSMLITALEIDIEQLTASTVIVGGVVGGGYALENQRQNSARARK